MHHPILFSLFLCTLGTVTQWPSKPTMLDALLDAIAEARVTSKEVYMPLGYTQSHWSKIERGEASLPFHRLQDLPPAVKDKLLPKIAYVFWSHRQSVSETRSA
jgi:hypothetical protein